MLQNHIGSHASVYYMPHASPPLPLSGDSSPASGRDRGAGLSQLLPHCGGVEADGRGAAGDERAGEECVLQVSIPIMCAMQASRPIMCTSGEQTHNVTIIPTHVHP